jgi:Carboxypeptidase regulatory-like domain
VLGVQAAPTVAIMRLVIIVAVFGAMFAATAMAGTVTGQVVEGGVRVAEYGVVTPDGQVHEVSDGDGRFRISVPDGVRHLKLVGWAFETFELDDVEVTTDGTDVGTITVQPGRAIHGRVTTAKHSPVAGATVMVFDHRPNEVLEPLELMANDVRAAITSGDGSYVIDGIGDGSYLVAAVGGELTSAEHPVPSDGSLDLVLERTGKITGTIARPNTTMIAAAVGFDDVIYTTDVDDNGAFEFEVLPVGRYDLTSGDAALRLAPLRVEVRAALTVVVPFAIPKRLASLAVEARSGDCATATLFGARQHERTLSAELATVTCDDDGVALFTGLAPGPYRVCVDDDRCEELAVKGATRVRLSK